MRTRGRLLLAGLASATLLSTAVSTAAANRLSVSETEFEVKWEALVFAEAFTNITCPVTMLGRFHSRTIVKVTRILVGMINHAVVGRCEFDGRATVLQETLPWHITYDGFIGTLPAITHIRLHMVGASFRVGDGIFCLARTDFAEPAVGTAVTRTATGQISTLNANPEAEIEVDERVGLCALAEDVSLSGNGRVTTLSGSLIFIRLI